MNFQSYLWSSVAVMQVVSLLNAVRAEIQTWTYRETENYAWTFSNPSETPQDYYLSRYAYKFVLLNEQTDFIKSGAPKVVFSVGKLSFKMERMILKNYRNVTNNESMGNHYESWEYQGRRDLMLRAFWIRRLADLRNYTKKIKVI